MKTKVGQCEKAWNHSTDATDIHQGLTKDITEYY